MNHYSYIENLVFEGGGVKGIAYAGAIEVLESQNILQNATSVAGTSAGAITATLVALNYGANDIKDIIMDMDFKKFEDGFNPFRLFSSYGLYKGKVFLKWMEDKIVKAGLPQNATFEDMSTNESFKSLKIFATDLNTENIVEFSASNTPKTIVAEAVRASMSIPLFFKSWRFSNKMPNDHIYVDGGVLYNYPIEVFSNLDKTLGFYLKSFQGKKPSNLSFKSPVHYVKALFETLLKSQSVEFQKNQLEKQSTVIINDLNVSATDFKLSDEMKMKLIEQGKIATQKKLGLSDIFSSNSSSTF